MLGPVRITREHDECTACCKYKDHADHGFLYFRPVLLRPGEQQRAGECRKQRRALNAPPLRFETEPISAYDSQSRDLRDGEIDEYDATAQHLNAKRHVSCGNENTSEERRPEDVNINRAGIHLATATKRSIVSSNKPKRSFALSVPPTVNGSITAGILACCDNHSTARGSL